MTFVPETPPTPRLCIAIVDDEEAVRVSLRRLLQSLGLDVIAYASGPELLEALDVHRAEPDCLIVDAHMPQMTGLDIQHHLVARGVRFPTIVYSADDEPEALDRYIAAGAFAYLRKPLRGNQLIAVVERAVAASRSREAATEQREPPLTR